MIRRITQHFFIFALVGFLANFSYAQDAHWSQFNSNPLALNPSMAGVYSGTWRAGINYRNQWASVIGPNPFQSMQASFEYRLQAIQRDFMTFGVHISNDQAGTGGYTTNQALITFSYLKEMAGNPRTGMAQYIVLSAQAGLGQRVINWDELSFSAQFNGDTYDPTLPTYEQEGISSLIYPDFNAGIMWYGVFDDRKSVYLGAALHHLNRPSISYFNEQNDYLQNKITLHLGGEYPLGKVLSVLPGVLAMRQGPSTEMMLGANLRYMNDDWNDVALRVGAWGRVVNKAESGFGTDAATVMAGIDFQSISLGLSYDLNTSTLLPATNRQGAFELSLYYTSKPKSMREGLKCPKF